MTLGLPVEMVQKDQQGKMERMALMARLVFQGLLGIEVSQEKMELLEFKAYLVIKDHQEGKDRQAYLGIKDPQENKETR